MNRLRKLSFGQIFIIAIVVMLFASTVVSGAIAYAFYKEAQVNYDSSAADAMNQTESADQYAELIGKVRAAVLVPEDEKPTIAAIADIEQVKTENPQFYADAQDGDIVLIFSTKAIIYRESAGMIINIAPVIRAEAE